MTIFVDDTLYLWMTWYLYIWPVQYLNRWHNFFIDYNIFLDDAVSLCFFTDGGISISTQYTYSLKTVLFRHARVGSASE